MAKQTINIGTVANDKTGDQLRTAFTKINSNFTELYDGAGGAGNTGSITFEANTIVGNGSEDGDFTYGRLSLVPNDSTEGQSFTDYGQYIDIYPTLAQDAPHIHIAPGKGAEMTGDLILGDDSYNVDVNHNGYIRVKSYNFDTEYAYQWDFTVDGKLNFPMGGAIEPHGMGWIGLTNGTSGTPVSVAYKKSGINGEDLSYIYLSGDDDTFGQFNITTSKLVGETFEYYSWNFNPDGSITFPNKTVNLHNGGNQSAQTLQFADPDLQAVITGPTPAADENAERLIIQGQRGTGTGEGGDVYLWGGDADGTNGGDIKIYAGDADDGTAGSGGYVNIDGGRGFTQGGVVEITGGYSAGGTGGNVNIRSGSGVTSADDGIVTVQVGSYNWQFNNTGALVFPDNTTQTTAGVGRAGTVTTVEIDGDPTTITGLTPADTIFVKPAVGYTDSDTHSLAFLEGRAVNGLRTVVINNSSLCTVEVYLIPEDPFNFSVAPSTSLEVVYITGEGFFPVSQYTI